MRGDLIIQSALDVKEAADYLRHLPAVELDEPDIRCLERTAALLRGGAYSATTAARRLEALVRAREAS